MAEPYEELKQQFRRVSESISPEGQPARSGGSGPTDFGGRVERLEADMKEVKSVLSRLEPMITETNSSLKVRLPAIEKSIGDLGNDIRSIQKDVARLDGRVSQMPTAWQLIGLVVAIFAAAFALMRLAIPTH